MRRHNVSLYSLFALLHATSGYVLVCYYTSWSATRSGDAAYHPEYIPPRLCTHIVFAFAKLKDDTIVKGGWMDEAHNGDESAGLYARVNRLKTQNPDLKVLLAIGGWGADKSQYSSTVSSQSRRKTFAKNAISYLRRWGFDGLDLDWEYPSGIDKERFTLWCQDIHAEFAAEGANSGHSRLLLTAAVLAGHLAPNHYEIDKLGPSLDLVHLMTYDFAGTWIGKTSFNTPIDTVKRSVTVWRDGAFPVSKLVLGMAAYGRSFTLPAPIDVSPGATTWNGGTPGKYSQESGILFYYEVCLNLLNNAWTSVWNVAAAAPYAYKGNQWVTYDDVRSINAKIDVIKSWGLAGGMVWALGQDDFADMCRGGRYPLISTMNNRLLPQSMLTSVSSSAFTQADNTVSTVATTTSGQTSNAKILACYYTNWSQYRRGTGKFFPADISSNLCTHIIYAFAELKNNELTPREWNDVTLYKSVMRLKKENPSIKILLAIGGWNAGSTQFVATVSSKATRDHFLAQATAFLRHHEFDGLDLDWEYPSGSYVQLFTTWCQELKKGFEEEAIKSQKQRLLLTAAVRAGAESKNHYETKLISRELDYVFLMSYDFNGGWSQSLGLNSPLPDVIWSAEDWILRGTPANKLVLGMPTYGRSFTLNSANTSPGASFSGKGKAGKYTNEAGILSYYEICTRVASGWTVEWDSTSSAPYAYSGNQWVGYDDPCSLQKKVNVVKSLSLAGAMVWAVPLDDFGNLCGDGKFPLISLINSQLIGARPAPSFQCAGVTTAAGSTASTATTAPPTAAPPTAAPPTAAPPTAAPPTAAPPTAAPPTAAPPTAAPPTAAPPTAAPPTAAPPTAAPPTAAPPTAAPPTAAPPTAAPPTAAPPTAAPPTAAPPTAAPPTAAPPTAAPTGRPCQGKSAGSYQADPTSCYHYYVCAGDGTGTRGQCQQILYWNQAVLACDHKYNVDCKVPETTTPEGYTPSDVFSCDGRLIGYHPDPFSCTHLYQCDASGKAWRHACQEGLYYNPAVFACDNKANVACQQDALPTTMAGSTSQKSTSPATSQPPTTATRTPMATRTPITPQTTSAPQTTQSSRPCEGKSAGSYQADPTSCYHYYVCAGDGTGTRGQCQQILYWNQAVLACDHKYNVDCHVPETTTPEGHTPSSEFSCEGRLIGYHPDPLSCSHLYQCDAHGKAWRIACHPDLYYNPKVFACDHKANVDCRVKRSIRRRFLGYLIA